MPLWNNQRATMQAKTLHWLSDRRKKLFISGNQTGLDGGSKIITIAIYLFVRAPVWWHAIMSSAVTALQTFRASQAAQRGCQRLQRGTLVDTDNPTCVFCHSGT
ncbi:hypothetical protein XENOCAPTIV_025901 [Xenoophorus captivus]|uniref:Uncharacterized protein n=1 Tax=Xenoophorus captivus TaxID=1517983 RepID=A0ABV0SBP0_9TELE